LNSQSATIIHAESSNKKLALFLPQSYLLLVLFHNQQEKKMGRPNTVSHALLDAVIVEKGLRNDGQLAEALQFQASVISKIRNGKVDVSDTFRVRLQRVMGWSLARIDKLAPPAADAE
jgi:hypothetical protein